MLYNCNWEVPVLNFRLGAGILLTKLCSLVMCYWLHHTYAICTSSADCTGNCGVFVELQIWFPYRPCC